MFPYFNAQVLEEYSQRNYSDAVCFLAVFISHGTDGKIVMKKDRLDVGEHIIRTFNGKNCEGLRDKPKIFIVAVSNICRQLYLWFLNIYFSNKV